MPDRPKICIYGAGAIGSWLGARLAGTDADLSLVARGPHLRALQNRGLELQSAQGSEHHELACTDDPRSLGPQDFVVLTLKAHSVAPDVERIATLLGPETAIVTAQNGILWWHFHAIDGPWTGHHLDSTDPGGRIWNALGPERAIGAVVYASCEMPQPGVVRHAAGNRFLLGEPDGTKSGRARRLGGILAGAGLKAPVRTRIRDDIWFKLLGNATFNPVSVLTGATLEDMGRDVSTRQLLLALMREAAAVARAFGTKFPMTLEQRIQGAVDVGAHKTSMLQDFERGKALELGALVESVSEIGRLVGVPTPLLDTVIALVRLKAPAQTAAPV